MHRQTAKGKGSAKPENARNTKRSAGSVLTHSMTPHRINPVFAAAFMQDGIVEFDKVAENFGMSKIQLAETIGLSKEAIYRKERLEAVKAQTRTREMLEIIGRIADWAGGERQAMAWYRGEPIPAFGGRTAESLVKDGKATAVRDYLDHIATGGFA